MGRRLEALDRLFPLRYGVWLLCGALAVTCGLAGVLASSWPIAALAIGFALLALLGVHDVRQSSHSILVNYPVIGHLRFLLEFIRPEIRQYFIESDRDKVPFSRQQRAVVYQRAKGAPDKRPFGTQLEMQGAGYEWINHSWRATELPTHDFRVSIGTGGSSCTRPYEASLFNISAMSFGALSARAILALNAGARRGGFAHDTGEGSISEYHREHGGDLIWEIGSGYFGCRDAEGRFDEANFVRNASEPQVRMIELKLSQGAKPGHGGVLPGPKVTAEIAVARGVTPGVDCVSPANHSAFGSPFELLHFIERLRVLSGGKPVGFKLCIGHPWEWFALCQAMLETGLLPDFIVVDGSEGGTARVHRSPRNAIARWPSACARHAHRAWAALAHQDRLRRQDHRRLRYRPSAGAWRRLVQRSAWLHVRAGMHPGPDLSQWELPDRGGDAGSSAPAGTRCRGQE